MLAVTSDHVLQVFFNNSQNNFLHNFTRHWSKNDRSVVPRIILLALLENWNIFQLPVNCDLSRFPRLFKNLWERSQTPCHGQQHLQLYQAGFSKPHIYHEWVTHSGLKHGFPDCLTRSCTDTSSLAARWAEPAAKSFQGKLQDARVAGVKPSSCWQWRGVFLKFPSCALFCTAWTTKYLQSPMQPTLQNLCCIPVSQV